MSSHADPSAGGHGGLQVRLDEEGCATMIAPQMPKLRIAVTAVTSVLAALATGARAQTVPANLPAAILCFAPPDQSWRAIYLSKVNKNGDVVYITPDGRLTAKVNAKGVMEAPTDRQGSVDCYGKTIDELRSSGRILEFPGKK
jgi:hypothetical protein